eukprot:gnl/TRDRNA2_/TRDRNA2_168356_c1_seq1.p2 gnl/TRDRNA2_/TRDRNA2_168356_c1~~gnl/TRDRNA2_/TRDRNA2_168356_c1_seq1.p2  ORF type:complete len:129 (+),score=11.24 gnl/TRDRNA2_/TRDRNA2_168356_c1_seq1:385-771(+)
MHRWWCSGEEKEMAAAIQNSNQCCVINAAFNTQRPTAYTAARGRAISMGVQNATQFEVLRTSSADPASMCCRRHLVLLSRAQPAHTLLFLLERLHTDTGSTKWLEMEPYYYSMNIGTCGPVRDGRKAY